MKRMLDFRKMRLVLACLAIIAVILLVSSDASPALSQDPSELITIESDDAHVGQTGIWTSQNAAEASGGSYLYSSGDEDDALTLDFYGSTIEITYTSHPAFGSFAIEVDNTILRTVVATSEEAAFGQQAVIDYLVDEPHTLRVFAVDGVVAIDAFTTQLPPPPDARAEAGTPEALTCNPDTFPIRASIADNDLNPNGPSTQVSMSGDGRYVAFSSTANNLLTTGDSNSLADIFVFDRLLCIMTRVNLTSAGGHATGGVSLNPSISQDGRYVAFESYATNLVAGDTNGFADIFVHDRQTGTTTRVSVTNGGAQATGGHSTKPSISNDGQRIAFQSNATDLVAGDSNTATDIFVRNLTNSTTVRASVSTAGTQTGASRNSTEAAISGNGQFVAFQSNATNLTVGESASVNVDIFVRDINNNITTRVSVATGGSEVIDGDSVAPDISNDGRYVAFESNSEDIYPSFTEELNNVFVHDRNTTTTTPVSVKATGEETDDDSNAASISGNGKYVAFYSGATDLVAGDTDGVDIFVKDIATGAIVRASLLGNGTEPTNGILISRFPSMSDSGRNVAFETQADLTADASDNNSPNEDIYVADIPFNTAPSDLIGTGVGQEEIALHWNDNSSSEVRYNIYRSIDGFNWPAQNAPTTHTNVADFRDWTDTSGLECETTYYYRVAAFFGGSSYSEYSNVATARTLLCAMSPPSNLTVTGTGQQTVDLTWNDESNSESEFRVERSINGIDWAQIDKTDPNVEAYKDQRRTAVGHNVACNTTYFYQIIAFRAIDGNTTPPSNVVMTTTAECTDPGVSTPLTPIGSTASSIPVFTFTEANSGIGYQIQVCTGTFSGATCNGTIRLDNTFEPGVGKPVQCSAGICSVSPGVELSINESPFQWRVRGWHDDVTEPINPAPYSSPISFSITPPVPISPVSTVLTSNYSNTFSWQEIPDVPWYKIYVTDPLGVVIHNVWHEAAGSCSAGTCSITLPNPFARNGAYKWYIRGWSPGGYGPWTSEINFTVTVPAAVVPTNIVELRHPDTNIPNGVQWKNDLDTAYYLVYINAPSGVWLNKWYSKNDLTCDASNCQVGVNLPWWNGTYNIYMQAWNPSGLSAWTGANPFTVNTPLPALPTGITELRHPDTNIPNGVQWTRDVNTSHYLVYINAPSGIWVNKWYTLGDGLLTCGVSTCQISLNLNWLNGNYNIYMRGWNNVGFSDWTGATAFTINTPLPALPTGITELRDGVTNIPNGVQWTRDVNTSHYLVYINAPSGIWLNKWYTLNDGLLTCGASTCQISLNLNWLNGTYNIYMQAWNSAGLSAWTGANPFTVNTPVAAVPSGIVELRDGVTNIPNGVRWNEDVNTSYYLVYINAPSGIWLNKWYTPTDGLLTCGGGTCQIAVNLPWLNGAYNIYMQAWNSAGLSAWTGANPFTVNTPLPTLPTGITVLRETVTDIPNGVQWTNDVNASHYLVYINGPGGVWLNKWYQKNDGLMTCGGGTCQISLNFPWYNGNYNVYMRAWNSIGFSNWTGANAFSVAMPPPSSPSLISPTEGTFLTTGTNQYQWNALSHASHYFIEFRSSTGVILQNLSFAHSAICSGGVCSVNVLQTGHNITWRVRGWSAEGSYGLYSASNKITVLE